MTELERREQELVLGRLREDARTLVRAFDLPLNDLDAERPNVRRRYGVCDSDGNIRIRLRHAKTGRLLKYSSLVDTLCHELAHLKHFNHGPLFKRFYLRLLAYARRVGIYRPTPRLSTPEADTGIPAAPLYAAKGAGRTARRPDEALPAQLDLFSSPRGRSPDPLPRARRPLGTGPRGGPRI